MVLSCVTALVVRTGRDGDSVRWSNLLYWCYSSIGLGKISGDYNVGTGSACSDFLMLSASGYGAVGDILAESESQMGSGTSKLSGD